MRHTTTTTTTTTPASGGSISGHLVGADPAGAWAYLYFAATYMEVQGVPIDAGGGYSFSGVAPGSYRVGVSSPGISRWYPSARDFYQATAITVDVDQQVTGIDVSVPTGAISGTVRVGATPRPWMSVTVENTVGGPTSSATTDASGDFMVPALDPGTYRVYVDAAGTRTYHGGSSSVTVTVGSTTVTGIDIDLPAGEISGDIVDAGGQPVSGWLDIQPTMGGTSATVYVMGATFDVVGLPLGSYRLAYREWDGRRYQFPDVYTLTEVSPVQAVSLQLPATGALEGTVYSAPGVPAASAYVTLYDATGTTAGSVGADGNGHYRFESVYPGTYRVGASVGMTGTVYHPDVSSLAAATPVTVTAGDTTAGVDIAKPSRSISGHVLAGATPLAGVGMTACVSPMWMPCYSTSTGADGGYSFEGLDLGSYRVNAFGATGTRYYPSTPDSMTATLVGVTTETPNVTGIDIVYPGGSITGTVTVGGVPRAGVSVGVESASGGMYMSRSATTDAAGAYTVGTLEPGTYRVYVDAGATRTYYGGSSTVTVAVGAAATEDIDIDLPPGRISGTILDAASQPVNGSLAVQRVDAGGSASVSLMAGNFDAVGLAIGSYRLVYNAWDGSRYTFPDTYVVSASTPTHVVALQLPGTGAIEGTVYAAPGVPAPWANVSLYDATGASAGWTSADMSGHYRFSTVFAGTYRVGASINMGGNIYHPDATSLATATAVSVTTGATVSGIDLSRPNRSISGRVLVGTTPLASVMVTVCTLTGSWCGNTSTDASGNYTITGLDAGSYRVYASSSYGFRYHPSVTDSNAATPVVVTLAVPNVTGIDITYPAGAISGTVRFRGAPAVGVSVTFDSVGGAMNSTQTTTNASGDYVLAGLAAGSYRVRASTGGQPVFAGGAIPTIVTVTDAMVTGIDIDLPSGALSISVTTAGGQPASNGPLYIVDTTTGSSWGTSLFNGTASLIGLPYGTYTVRYSSMNGGSYDFPDSIVLSAANPTGVAAIQLPEPASIAGTVRRSDGTPVAYASVQVSASTGSQWTMTAADGSYTVAGLFPGTYTIGAIVSGSTLYSPGVRNQTNATKVVLVGGTSRTGIDIDEPNGSIAGTVTVDGQPVAGATVYAHPGTAGDSYVAQTTTALDGTYRLTGFEAGDYRVSTFRSGLGTRWYPSGAASASATVVHLTASTPSATGVDISYGAGHLEGTVTQRGVPQAGATVTALPTTGSDGPSATTDATGHFSIIGLEPGSYGLRAQNATATVVVGGSSAPTRFTITAAAPVVTGLDVVLPGGTVSGTVTTSTGQAASPSNLYVVGIDGTVGGGQLNVVGGSFSKQGLPDGTYAIGLRRANYGSLYLTPLTFEITAADPDVVGLAVVLPAPASMHGTVRRSDGTPVASATVTLRDRADNGNLLSVVTGADGSYTFTDLLPGSYSIFTMSGGGAYSTPWFLPGTRLPSAATAITVQAGDDLALADLVVPLPASASGQVTDTSGAPVAGASVEVLASDSAYLPMSSVVAAAAVTTSNGEYTLTGLPIGVDLRIRITPPAGSGLATEWWDGAAWMSAADVLRPTAAQALTGLDVVLGEPAAISGRVLDPNGALVPSVVLVFPTAPTANAQVRSVEATEGTYSVTDLVAGDYLLAVRPYFTNNSSPFAPGFLGGGIDPAEATVVTVAAGQTLTGTDITFEVGPTISGRVTGPDGEPVANISVYATATTSAGQIIGGTNVTAVTEADGSYQLQGLAADTYRIIVSPFMGLLSEAYPASHDLMAGTEITVGPADAVTGVDVQLDRAIRVEITAVDAAGQTALPPTAGFTLDLHPLVCPVPVVPDPTAYTCGSERFPTTTLVNVAKDGWTVLIPPGDFTVQMGASSTRSVAAGTSLTVADGQRASCTLPVPGASATPVCTLSTEPVGATLSGRITGPTGAGVGGITITAERTEGENVITTTTSAPDGTYVLRHVDPGTFRLHATVPWNRTDLVTEWYAVAGDAYRFVDADPLVVGADATLTGLDVALTRAAGGNVTITSGGVPTTSASVVLCKSPADIGPSFSFTCTDGSSVRTGNVVNQYHPDGRYRVDRLEPGTYNVRAYNYWSGTQGPAAIVTLAAGDHFDCMMPLDAAPVCVVEPFGSDADGVSPEEEQGAPNDGDGNDDGVPDAEQTTVGSLIDPTVTPEPGDPVGSNYVTIDVAPPADVAEPIVLEDLAVDPLPSEPPPAGITPQSSLISFTVANLPVPSETVQPTTVSIDVYLPLPANAYLKYDAVTGWTDATPLVVFDENNPILIGGVERWKATLTITDGGLGDQDGVADGRIVDPGVWAFLQTDTTPPVITCSARPTFALDAAATLTADVSDADSGVGAPTVSVAVSTSTAGLHHVTISAADLAGNAATTSCDYGVAYRIVGTVSPAPNAAGWYRGSVKVTWSAPGAPASANLVLPAPTVLSGNGANQTASSGPVCDADGVCGTGTVTGISIDTTRPTVTCPSATYVLRQQQATLTAAVTDGLSGPSAPTVSVSVSTSTVGLRSVSVTGRDLAGNTRTVSCRYRVRYQFAGFRSPIDDSKVNVARTGDVVAVSWRITDAAGRGISDRDAIDDVTFAGVACPGLPQTTLPRDHGREGLRYLGNGVWELRFEVERRWDESCRELRLWLDGSATAETVVLRFR